QQCSGAILVVQIGLPNLGPCSLIEGDDAAVLLRGEHYAIGNVYTTICPSTGILGGDVRDVLPQDTARLGVQGEDVHGAGRDIHDAVAHHGCGFLRLLQIEARAVQACEPGAFEVLDVVRGDLGQRGVARVAPVATRHRPVLAC